MKCMYFSERELLLSPQRFYYQLFENFLRDNYITTWFELFSGFYFLFNHRQTRCVSYRGPGTEEIQLSLLWPEIK